MAVGPAEGWDHILQKIPQGQVDLPSLQLRQQSYQGTLAPASFLSFIHCQQCSLPISGLASLKHRFYNLKRENVPNKCPEIKRVRPQNRDIERQSGVSHALAFGMKLLPMEHS